MCAGSLSTLGVSRFCEKYPAVLATLQRSLLELVCNYQKQVLGWVTILVPSMHSLNSARPALAYLQILNLDTVWMLVVLLSDYRSAWRKCNVAVQLVCSECPE